MHFPFEFVLFGLMLLGIAVLHHRTLAVAIIGLAAIICYKIGFSGFTSGSGFPGLINHLEHEFVLLANLFGLLMGFAILSGHFAKSRVSDVLPVILPDDWKGGFFLLCIVFVLSAFLDNIAGALIGGTMAQKLFSGRVHIGYLAAIVAASNAGGAGSVIGDTTTTMMWLAGVSALELLKAYVAAIAALLVFGIPASLQQHAYAPIAKDIPKGTVVDWGRLIIVVCILVSALAANIGASIWAPHLLDRWPVIGLAVWTAIFFTALGRRPDWAILPETLKGTAFLLALVVAASLMPVEALPVPSWTATLGLGFVSAVFDNIPLTALALKQGGYDWPLLAYAVGFGGSMIWFGSSAGVAVANMFPEAKSVGLWLKHGWQIVPAYLVGFFLMMVALGWKPG